MKIALSKIYKAIKEQADYVNLNNSIHSLEYCKTEIEFKEKHHMKTSEFRAELKKLGYTFEDNLVKNKQGVTSAYISTVCVNKMDTISGADTLGGEMISDELFSLLTCYAATPIAEREDEKLFNVQIVKGKWGCASWLYRFDDDYVITSSSDANDCSNQQWTLAQIKKYGIDDETVYKRVPVGD